jgi:hypothetical protein
MGAIESIAASFSWWSTKYVILIGFSQNGFRIPILENAYCLKPNKLSQAEKFLKASPPTV